MSGTQAALATAQRLAARLQENLAESTRDLGISALDGALNPGSSKYLEPGALSGEEGFRETRRLLESTRDRDREDGLRRVLAIMSKAQAGPSAGESSLGGATHARHAVSFFPFVSNCLSSSSLTVKSLVSTYIVRYATQSPDLALMVVNTYQKDLADSNPLVRALALRTLSGMNLDSTIGLVIMCLQRCSRDNSWYVRKASAGAIEAIGRLDPSQLPQLLPTLSLLLGDRSSLVLGAAYGALEQLCLNRWDLVHPHYRATCRLLVDADEWGQITLMRVLSAYARSNFQDPDRTIKGIDGKQALVDPDLDLLLRAAEPLLQSCNPAVVMACNSLLRNLAPRHYIERTIRPLLRLLHTTSEIQHSVLLSLIDCIESDVEVRSLLRPYLPEFFIRSSDTRATRSLKLLALTLLANQSNVQILYRELKVYVGDVDETFSALAIDAMGRCALAQPQAREEALATLLDLIDHSKGAVVDQSVTVIQLLLAQQPKGQPKLQHSRAAITTRLLGLVHQGKLASARSKSKIYWLVGQYSGEGLLSTIAPDALRIAALGFATETQETKMQIVSMAAKIVVRAQMDHSPLATKLLALVQYVIALSRYDLSYQVRDRARFMLGLLTSAGLIDTTSAAEKQSSFAQGLLIEDEAEAEAAADPPLSIERVCDILFKEHDATAELSLAHDRDLGPLSRLAGKRMPDDRPLPPWTEIATDPLCREPAQSAESTANGAIRSIAGSSERSHVSMKSRTASPVVLTPTARSGDMTPSRGPRNLDSFLASEGEEASSDEATSEEGEEQSSEASESEEEEGSTDEEA
ncbi:uncharacterized protein L969DRAFT_15241 [Mixia osmundae IAM 14324]|uniref:Clathrin/coatomer adaptor adaptin-like N-terminal domain-containing protein n=1 Tax=Mixia osmundae (strain CBS 9802 / IAM 14324 / JCM 22182 / KY 12970) TaxID=764103 RepID=G7DXH5_MIXOS|nr:uncharacterized protein L969DRAFT_15241 [Mixia osmundae IAM 14324]KEI41221.1 hypothetical protein L969DRAFT_15241 [Mixia osmundae IAM 14324]GAA95285.1 hypothetical protein E5Q_01941 [Mixia osmundae IAM 14324]